MRIVRGAFRFLPLFLVASPPAFGQSLDDTFTCTPDRAETPAFGMRATDGGLRLLDGRTSDFGPVVVTPSQYVARQSRPMMKDGTGLMTTSFTINRATGRYSFVIDANAPGRPPFHTVAEGRCEGLDAVPQSDASKAATSTGKGLTLSADAASDREDAKVAGGDPASAGRRPSEAYQPGQDKKVCKQVDRSGPLFNWDKDREVAVRHLNSDARKKCFASGDGGFSIAGLACTQGEGVWKCSARVNCNQNESVCTTPNNGGASRQ